MKAIIRLAVAAATLAVSAAIAGLIPARRVASINPVEAFGLDEALC